VSSFAVTAHQNEGETMKANFMVKVEDAKLSDIQKALKAAGIAVRSIIQVYKEDVKDKNEGEQIEKESNDKENDKKTG
jgi:hypothetical protein